MLIYKHMNTLTKALAFAALVATPFVGHAQILPTHISGQIPVAPTTNLLATPSVHVTVPVTTAHVSNRGLPVSVAPTQSNPGISINIPSSTLLAHPNGTLVAVVGQVPGTNIGSIAAVPSSTLASAQLPIASSTNAINAGSFGGFANIQAVPASTLANSGHVSISGTTGGSNSGSGNGSNSGSSGSSGSSINYSSGSIPSGYGYHAPAVNAVPTASESSRYAYAQSGVTQGASSTPRTIVKIVSEGTDVSATDMASASSDATPSRNPTSGQASVFGLGFLPQTLVGWMAIILGLLAVMVGVREYRIIDAQKKLAAQQYASSGSYGSQMYVPRPVSA